MSNTYQQPKYRSLQGGCCICKTKTSSSRFTDSKPYQSDFYKCFRLREERSGDICNPCVLIVKRSRHLPLGTDKHWHYILDGKHRHRAKSQNKHRARGIKAKPKEGGLSDNITIEDSDSSRSRSLSPLVTVQSASSAATFIDETFWKSKKEYKDHTVYTGTYGIKLVVFSKKEADAPGL